jgi:hypothetical protein
LRVTSMLLSSEPISLIRLSSVVVSTPTGLVVARVRTYSTHAVSVQCPCSVKKVSVQCPCSVKTVSVQCKHIVSAVSVQCQYSVIAGSVQCQYSVSAVSVHCQCSVSAVSVHCQCSMSTLSGSPFNSGGSKGLNLATAYQLTWVEKLID